MSHPSTVNNTAFVHKFTPPIGVILPRTTEAHLSRTAGAAKRSVSQETLLLVSCCVVRPGYCSAATGSGSGLASGAATAAGAGLVAATAAGAAVGAAAGVASDAAAGAAAAG